MRKTDRRHLTIALRGTPSQADARLHEQIRTLDRECFPADDPFDPAEHWHWLATYRGKTVGWSSAKIWQGDLFIDRQGVRAAWRRLGCQRRMLRAILRWAARHGFQRVVSYTHTQNCPSSNNFIACEFRTFDPPQTFGEAFIHWEKTL